MSEKLLRLVTGVVVRATRFPAIATTVAIQLWTNSLRWRQEALHAVRVIRVYDGVRTLGVAPVVDPPEITWWLEKLVMFLIAFIEAVSPKSPLLRVITHPGFRQSIEATTRTAYAQQGLPDPYLLFCSRPQFFLPDLREPVLSATVAVSSVVHRTVVFSSRLGVSTIITTARQAVSIGLGVLWANRTFIGLGVLPVAFVAAAVRFRRPVVLCVLSYLAPAVPDQFILDRARAELSLDNAREIERGIEEEEHARGEALVRKSKRKVKDDDDDSSDDSDDDDEEVPAPPQQVLAARHMSAAVRHWSLWCKSHFDCSVATEAQRTVVLQALQREFERRQVRYADRARLTTHVLTAAFTPMRCEVEGQLAWHSWRAHLLRWVSRVAAVNS